jgi:hypothetical protein
MNKIISTSSVKTNKLFLILVRIMFSREKPVLQRT